MIRQILFALAASWLVASFATAAEAPRLAAHAVVELPAPSSERGEIDLVVAGFDQRWRLRLHDNRAPFAELAPATRAAIEANGNRLLAGKVAGQPQSWARLNWVDGRWWGGFHDGKNLYLIDRAGQFQWPGESRPAAGQSLLFRAQDLDLSDVIGHDPLLPGPDFAPAIAAEAPQPAGSASLSMPVTIVTDTAFQTSHGSSLAATVLGRINFVDGIYTSQVGTGIVVHHLEQLADDGPLTPTGASDLISAFRSFMAAGAGSAIPFQGLAHLFTSRDRDGNIAGIAYMNALCNSHYGYGVDWDSYGEVINSLVFAHELGHNFSAPHDGENTCSDETFEGIMYPSVSSSRQQFSQCSLDHMQPAAAAASCRVATPGAGWIFSDAFEPSPL